MRKICVFTGSRAEYGLLKLVITEIDKDPDLELQLVVSGMHLSAEFGFTYQEIVADGFKINEKVEMLLSSDTPLGISKSIGLGIQGFSEALNRLKPDLTVVLGDRFEALAFAIAATVMRIPIAHLYGGEVSVGAMDEAFRHSITKMSHVHFTCAEKYRQRVIQLGEIPDKVFNVGGLGTDNIRKLKLLTKEELEESLDVKFKRKNLIITYHPVTLEKSSSQKQFQTILSVLDELEDTFLLFTKANADTDGRIINKMIEEFVSQHSEKSAVFASLGELRYLSVMKIVDGVVGNSSSGIVEAPAMKTATVNIGDRQGGRIKAASVIECEPEVESLRSVFRKLYSEEFRGIVKNVENPYGDGNATEKIMEVLKNTDLNNILKKKFYDLDKEF